MEADWEFEISGDAPVIDAAWSGFVDLRVNADRVSEIPEAAQLPALANALLALNGPGSAVWTAKCDVWEVDEFDPYEMDADPVHATHAVACYVDLLPRGDDHRDQQWTAPATAEYWCKQRVSTLREVSLRNCRVDFIIRRAYLTPTVESFGVTAYVTACGAGTEAAQAVLTAALGALVKAVYPLPGPSRKVQSTIRAARASSSIG